MSNKWYSVGQINKALTAQRLSRFNRTVVYADFKLKQIVVEIGRSQFDIIDKFEPDQVLIISADKRSQTDMSQDVVRSFSEQIEKMENFKQKEADRIKRQDLANKNKNVSLQDDGDYYNPFTQKNVHKMLKELLKSEHKNDSLYADFTTSELKIASNKSFVQDIFNKAVYRIAFASEFRKLTQKEAFDFEKRIVEDLNQKSTSIRDPFLAAHTDKTRQSIIDRTRAFGDAEHDFSKSEIAEAVNKILNYQNDDVEDLVLFVNLEKHAFIIGREIAFKLQIIKSQDPLALIGYKRDLDEIAKNDFDGIVNLTFDTLNASHGHKTTFNHLVDDDFDDESIDDEQASGNEDSIDTQDNGYDDSFDLQTMEDVGLIEKDEYPQANAFKQDQIKQQDNILKHDREVENLKHNHEHLKNRPTWDEYFAIQAIELSTRANCDRLHVGCVFVKDNQVLTTGYNGAVRGMKSCDEIGHLMVNGHCERVVHAEQNALLQAARIGQAVDGATVFVTNFPCSVCGKLLAQAGVKKICYLKDYKNNEYVEKIFKELGVEVEQVHIRPEAFATVQNHFEEYAD